MIYIFLFWRELKGTPCLLTHWTMTFYFPDASENQMFVQKSFTLKKKKMLVPFPQNACWKTTNIVKHSWICPLFKILKAPLHQKHSSWLNQTTPWKVFSFGFGRFYPFSRVNIPESPKNTSDENDLQHQYLYFLILLSILWSNECFYHSNLVVS